MFVSDDFDVPKEFEGPGFRLEPLGPVHNERDHMAWMSSIEHIRTTPGMKGGWPSPMTIEENLSDLEGHAREFTDREAFAYSVLDGEEVIGCLYIDPTEDEGHDAEVSSWVTSSRAEMDPIVWRSVSEWLAEKWPFENFAYARRI
ncbi:MAG: twin-arginine translocation pathway signal [Acidimicrobiia bacterium]|nr:twin-arginine translocation pathway signal [Acidimicrobiia bacterium]